MSEPVIASVPDPLPGADLRPSPPAMVWRVAHRTIPRPWRRGHRACAVYGADRLPRDGGYVLASNHLAWSDPFVVGMLVAPRVLYYMAKRELWSVPVVGTLIPHTGAFPVDRGQPDRDALRAARAVLDNGQVLGVFVEGTRQKTGEIGNARAGRRRCWRWVRACRCCRSACARATGFGLTRLPADLDRHRHAAGPRGLGKGGRAYKAGAERIEVELRRLDDFLRATRPGRAPASTRSRRDEHGRAARRGGAGRRRAQGAPRAAAGPAPPRRPRGRARRGRAHPRARRHGGRRRLPERRQVDARQPARGPPRDGRPRGAGRDARPQGRRRRVERPPLPARRHGRHRRRGAGHRPRGRRSRRARPSPRPTSCCSWSTRASASGRATRRSPRSCGGPRCRRSSWPTRPSPWSWSGTPSSSTRSGLGDPVPVSGLHGTGSGDLLDLIVDRLAEIPDAARAGGRQRRDPRRHPGPAERRQVEPRSTRSSARRA